ncbi:hypothetical protein [Ruminococcus sp.]|jgi:Mg/Co/Ni transporter MgtE|uniref:hypothetical protein n=1 Tax=Ruminococcus sp. TaxID=41978 RepID=UPI0035A66288
MKVKLSKLSVKDAMNELIRQAEENDSISTLFVVDDTTVLMEPLHSKILLQQEVMCLWKA